MPYSTEHVPMNGGGRGLTAAYIVMGLGILAAAVIAIVAVSYAQAGKSVCNYIHATYPSSHIFRTQIKGFVYDHYVHLKEEARAYRASAAQDPDAVTARLDRFLAAQLDEHAAVALADWRRITLPGPPTCS